MSPLANMQLITNEVRLKNNNLPLGKFTLTPKFTRRTGRMSENRYFLELSVDISGTEEKKFPIDLCISITGIFDLSRLPEAEREEYIKKEALRIVFPYLRTMVTNLTASALMTPLMLPVIDLAQTFGDIM